MNSSTMKYISVYKYTVIISVFRVCVFRVCVCVCVD